jgi:hypothetical protein
MIKSFILNDSRGKLDLTVGIVLIKLIENLLEYVGIW